MENDPHHCSADCIFRRIQAGAQPVVAKAPKGSGQQSAYIHRIGFEYRRTAHSLLQVMAVTQRRRMIMTNERQHDDLIDLGAASIETTGPAFGKDDVLTGQIPREGLGND
jgi:hypothetical protein